MKVALVRHVDTSLDCESVEKQIKETADLLKQLGFCGTNVGLYCSEVTRAFLTASFLVTHNNFPDPVRSPLLGLDDGEKSGRPLKNLITEGRLGDVFKVFRDGLVLVTHEPNLKTVTGRDSVNFGEVIFIDS